MKANVWDLEHGNKSSQEIKKIKRRVVRIIILLIIITIVCFVILPIYFAFNFLGNPPCENQMLDRKYNQELDYDLVVFKRNCGITTAFSYHLSIIKHDKKLKNRSVGNIYVSKDVFTASWTSNQSIQIADYTSDNYKKEYSYKEVKILYE